MTLFELVVPLGDKTSDDVLAIIMTYIKDSNREANNLPRGILSEERTRIYRKDGKAHAEKVVVFEGHSEGDYAVVVHKPHLLALSEQLKQGGFDCNDRSVWMKRVREESRGFFH